MIWFIPKAIAEWRGTQPVQVLHDPFRRALTRLIERLCHYSLNSAPCVAGFAAFAATARKTFVLRSELSVMRP